MQSRNSRVKGSRVLPSVFDSQTVRVASSNTLLRHPTASSSSYALDSNKALPKRPEDDSKSSSATSRRSDDMSRRSRHSSSQSSSARSSFEYQSPNQTAQYQYEAPNMYSHSRTSSRNYDYSQANYRYDMETDYGPRYDDRMERDGSHSSSPASKRGPPSPPKHRASNPLPKPPTSDTEIINHSTRPICALCDEYLEAKRQVVRTDYGHIHAECFVCSVCYEPLEHSEFYFRDNRAFCHLDYHQVYSAKCGYCDTPVESEGISALGMYWHRGHFFCHDCSTPFETTDNYYVEGKNIRCEACFHKRQVVKCWKCKTECHSAIEALGRTWCSTCFCCEVCTTPFESEEFVLRQDGTLVCQDCETRRIKQECWS